jgi:hypothetical protein
VEVVVVVVFVVEVVPAVAMTSEEEELDTADGTVEQMAADVVVAADQE